MLECISLMWEYLLELSVALQDVLVSRVLQDDAISLESTIMPLGHLILGATIARFL